MHILLVIILSVFDSLPGMQLIQDSTVAVLLEDAINGKRELVEIDGYRVQVYSSNQQQTAKESGKMAGCLSLHTGNLFRTNLWNMCRSIVTANGNELSKFLGYS